jgi:hypothetical protein
MKFLILLMFTIAGSQLALSQSKSIKRELKKVYGKEALAVFEKEQGGLDLLIYAYDHAIVQVNNNGGKDVAGIAKSNLSEIPVHFTELGVKIEPFTQYFQSPVPNEIIAVKSLFQLQLEMKNSKNNKN